MRTIYEFDDLYTAKIFGFGTADNYYQTQSSNQFLEHIRKDRYTQCRDFFLQLDKEQNMMVFLREHKN